MTARPCSASLRRRRKAAPKHQVPVVIEFILEKVTNIAMGTELEIVNEFEGALDVTPRMVAAE